METPELIPCPYCKESNLYVSDGDYYSGYESHGYRVHCRCGFAWRTVGWRKTKEEAIEEWNRRATDEQNGTDKHPT